MYLVTEGDSSRPGGAGPPEARPRQPALADHPGAVLAALADKTRFRALAAIALGATDAVEVAQKARLTSGSAVRAVERLVEAGIVADGGAGLEVRVEAFGGAARTVSRMQPRVTASDLGATPEQATVLRGYLDERGRLTHLPTQHSKRLVVLDFLAGRFEPGIVYAERDVTFTLQPLHRDYALLRRALVDAGFLERRDGFYWRSGGTTDP